MCRLGYDASERTLVINPAEAETVRRTFALYRELGCVRRVKKEGPFFDTAAPSPATARMWNSYDARSEKRGKKGS